MHSGFPPPDNDLRDWFQKQTGATSYEETEGETLHDFTCSLLTVLLDHLKDIESKEHLEEAKSGKCSDYPAICSQTTC